MKKAGPTPQLDTVEIVNLVCPDTTSSLGFSCHTCEHARPQNSSLYAPPYAIFLQSRTCNRPSLPPKGYKIHLSCHFFYKNSLQQYFAAKTKCYNQCLRLTSIVNLLPTESPTSKILFKRNSSSRIRTWLSALGDRGFTCTL